MPPRNDIHRGEQLTCLFGHPVAHSRSPEIHNRWLRAHHIDGAYEAFDITPEQLADTIVRFREVRIKGANLTIPLKEKVLDYVDVIDDVAAEIGAANTLYWQGDALHATNTDAYGFMENLHAQTSPLEPYLQHVVIIGAGGAARAAIYALKQAGATRMTLVNRTHEKAQKLAAQFGVQAAPWAQMYGVFSDATMLVNTTSLGMEGQPELPVSLEHLPQTALVHDIVYTPLHTLLLQQAQTRGNPIATGLGMLYYQAQAAFAQWHGVKPEVTLP
jgi:shikimate dehydrogenase